MVDLEPGFYWVVYGFDGDQGPEIARYDISMGRGLEPIPRWTFMDDVDYYPVDEEFGQMIKPVSDRLIPPSR